MNMDSSGFWNCSLLSNHHDQSSMFISSSTTLPTVGYPRHIMPPPKTLSWGQRNNHDSFQLWPITTISSNSPHIDQFLSSMHLSRHQIGGIVLCQVIPVSANSGKVLNEQLFSKRKAVVKISYALANIKNKELKCLQRGPILKAKKQEIFDKWKCKKLRRKFRSQQMLKMSNLSNSYTALQRSVSSFECPLWWCKKQKGQRVDHLEDEKDKSVYALRSRTRATPRPRSRASVASDLSRRRSRSPIIFRRQ